MQVRPLHWSAALCDVRRLPRVRIAGSRGHDWRAAMLPGRTGIPTNFQAHLNLASWVTPFKPPILCTLSCSSSPPVHLPPVQLQDPGSGADAAAAELRTQLSAAEQRLWELDTELAVREAAAREAEQRMRQMEGELEALRQHTITEFPATDPARPSGPPAASAEEKGLSAEERGPSEDQAPVQGRPRSEDQSRPDEGPSDGGSPPSQMRPPSKEDPPSMEVTESEERPRSRQTHPLKQSDPAGAEDPQRTGVDGDDDDSAPETRPQPNGEAQLQDTARSEQDRVEEEQREQVGDSVGQQPTQPEPQALGEGPKLGEDAGQDTDPEAAAAEGSTEERMQQLQERIQEVEAELEAARARIRELSEAGEGTKTVSFTGHGYGTLTAHFDECVAFVTEDVILGMAFTSPDPGSHRGRPHNSSGFPWKSSFLSDSVWHLDNGFMKRRLRPAEPVDDSRHRYQRRVLVVRKKKKCGRLRRLRLCWTPRLLRRRWPSCSRRSPS